MAKSDILSFALTAYSWAGACKHVMIAFPSFDMYSSSAVSAVDPFVAPSRIPAAFTPRMLWCRFSLISLQGLTRLPIEATRSRRQCPAFARFAIIPNC